MTDSQCRLTALERLLERSLQTMTDAELETFLAEDIISWDVLRSLSDEALQRLADGDPIIINIYEQQVAQRNQDHAN